MLGVFSSFFKKKKKQTCSFFAACFSTKELENQLSDYDLILTRDMYELLPVGQGECRPHHRADGGGPLEHDGFAIEGLLHLRKYVLSGSSNNCCQKNPQNIICHQQPRPSKNAKKHENLCEHGRSLHLAVLQGSFWRSPDGGALVITAFSFLP